MGPTRAGIVSWLCLCLLAALTPWDGAADEPQAGPVTPLALLDLDLGPGAMRVSDPGLAARHGGDWRAPWDAEAGAGVEAWFWREVSPALADGAAGRWPRLVRRLARTAHAGRAVEGADRLVETVIGRFGPMIRREAARRHLSVPLLVAMIAVESGGDPHAVSGAGAGGLMQLMPATARRFGVADRLRPSANLAGGARYLDWLLREFDEDVVLALAAYNAGEGAVRRHGGVPAYAETRAYVVKVADVFLAARRHCAEPPAGARGPCRIMPR